jgi:serine/threonine protein kinase
MADVVRVRCPDGAIVEYLDEVIGSGAMKDVYFTTDKSKVVAFFRNSPDGPARERLEAITGAYRKSLFEGEGGEYWKDLFCWPEQILEHDGRVGILVPAYPRHFFFEHGSANDDMLGIKGKEKQGKWFASANNRNRFLDLRERGHWLNYLQICLKIARAVRRMHAAGLAHSDLSYKNVLVAPTHGQACVIDVDGLVVPGKYPPDVVGTPDFIAPEVVSTNHLDKRDAQRKLPSVATDRHALAVLIYHYLLLRHPLRGDKVHDLDPQRDETLAMGRNALFVEHREDRSNRIKIENARASELPWKNTDALPYTVTGPYLSDLFERAFVDGLHHPAARPTADEWETALVKTVDLIQPCPNSDCGQQWYVFDNSAKPVCPFCGTAYRGQLPVLDFYSSHDGRKYRPDNHRLMVYPNQSLFPWHVNRHVVPNERISPQDRHRVGYFLQHNGRWLLVNERMQGLVDVRDNKPVPPGNPIELTQGLQLLCGRDRGDRLIVVQLAGSR